MSTRLTIMIVWDILAMRDPVTLIYPVVLITVSFGVSSMQRRTAE